MSLGKNAAILTGPSGSGKSDLALRFISETPSELDPALVSDDQIWVNAQHGGVIAYPPEAIAGKIEVRGVGIIRLPYCKQANVKLLIKLVEKQFVPRMPPSPLPTERLCGFEVPILSLSPFESSAPLKLRLALQNALG